MKLLLISLIFLANIFALPKLNNNILSAKEAFKISFEVQDGKKTPVKVTKHHHSQSLMQLHEDIAEQHRQYEQRVNYFKAKVKNLVSDENARIQKLNADKAAEFLIIEKKLNEEYQLAMDAYHGEVLRLTMEFNSIASIT